MYGIALTKRDKKVLRVITREGVEDLKVLPKKEFLIVIEHLRSLGLIEVRNYGGEFSGARLTHFGEKFKLENPKLRNDITDTNKWLISTIITLVIAILSIIIQIFWK